MLTPNETHELLKLHEKLDTLTKALHNLNLKAEVFVVDFSLHETQVDEIKSDILEVLDKINQVWDKQESIMWVMILMTSWFGNHEYKATTATPVQVVSVEFSSRERCLAAASFSKKQSKVYNAYCVQK